MDNIWDADLVGLQLKIKSNISIRFLLYVIDIYKKYTWFVLLKDKNGVTITNDFQEILDESGCKANRIWLNKGNEIYNKSIKSWL